MKVDFFDEMVKSSKSFGEMLAGGGGVKSMAYFSEGWKKAMVPVSCLAFK